MSQAKKLNAQAYMVVIVALLLISSDASTESASAASLETASIHMEQNATDADLEVVFEAKGQDDGLAELVVTAPDGRTVIDFKAPDSSTLGIRQFRFESPEPAPEPLLAAYPEGEYRFSGKTSSGIQLSGKSVLKHQLPPVPSLVKPAPDAKGVSVGGFEISWNPVQSVIACVVEIEQEEQQVSITARLPGSSTSFSLPNGFLTRNTEYHLGIGTVTQDGNISIMEATFTTE